jgi:hypothetical protein
VEMNWLTPTHLELTFKGNQSIVFQAVKWGGIEISIRDLSKAAVESENKTRSLAQFLRPLLMRKLRRDPFIDCRVPAPAALYRSLLTADIRDSGHEPGRNASKLSQLAPVEGGWPKLSNPQKIRDTLPSRFWNVGDHEFRRRSFRTITSVP